MPPKRPTRARFLRGATDPVDPTNEVILLHADATDEEIDRLLALLNRARVEASERPQHDVSE